ncbi:MULTISPECIES: hypothetical protein [Pseudoalteromonas]|jgi:hypothetical protein|uniref:DUF4382 domain-containing protein n=1 Tax=Pseudoalteromonas fuliginea TaxID=1872678 RepID=A0ABQ6RMQ8_9GAMM|nr:MULTISPECIES: hypothetical protein [Pseudoalteromonas]KAA1164740.1 hypothetical protein EU509_01890 [Pseudoalteromonas fuliginea]KAA1169351.1 hypothetical protein EUZ79_02000 [Pseudoalteromonas fuliginea]MDQ2044180.1 hypothetical protein [Pseudoalteromonas sp. 20-92]
MKFNQKILLCISFLFLTACASTTKNIKADQGLESNQGIVVTKIHSNWDGYNNPLLADLEFIFTQTDGKKKDSKFVLSKADDLKVVALPAGEYKWFRILFGNYYMDLSGGFTIKPNEITYIGDIHSQLDLGMFSMSGESRISNESEQIKNDLEVHFPKLLEKHKFTTKLSTLQQK